MAITKKISRREIFLGNSRKQASSSLDPYDKPLTQQQVYHLLRRTNFGLSYSFAQQLIGKTAHEAVELLFDNAKLPIQTTSLDWVNIGINSPFSMPEGPDKVKAIRLMLDTTRAQNEELKIWWMQLMQTDNQSIREKLTLFWHGHFTSQYSIPAQLMYRQNLLLREMHQADFQTFLQKITLDGAMLIYLNGQDNSSKAPNENYARELLELFTMGIGNYDEWDIREIAKVLTGWRTNFYTDNGSSEGLFQTRLNLDEHNWEAKYFFYTVLDNKFQASEANVRKYELGTLVDWILTKKADPTAAFISNKFYHYFVYSNAEKTDPTVIAGMAKTFQNNAFQIRPVLAQLLKSKHFFDESNIGVQIKNPTELVIGFAKNFSTDLKMQESLMTQLGQELLNPPNVAGWKGYRNWITTQTLPLAIATLSSFVDNQTNEAIANWAKQFPTYQQSSTLTKTIVEYFLPKSISADTQSLYENKLLGTTPDYEWFQIIQNDAFAGQKIKILLKELIKAPDFYLC